jgi:hypothetical protein
MYKIRKEGVYDTRLTLIEMYNRNKFTVVFSRLKGWDDYILSAGISLGPEKIILEPEKFVILPHHFYSAEGINGESEISLIGNKGREIGIGNKMPSRPDVKLS